jgi:hypothetical protein
MTLIIAVPCILLPESGQAVYEDCAGAAIRDYSRQRPAS